MSMGRGERITAKWLDAGDYDSVPSVYHPADRKRLADAIDAAIAAENEAC
jgi:hypothetical protein